MPSMLLLAARRRWLSNAPVRTNSQLLSTSLPDGYVKVTCKYFLDYFGFQNAPFGTIILT
jgi:hypothetical protein